MSENIEKFLNRVAEAAENSALVKMTLSKPVDKRDDLRNVYVKPVLIKEKRLFAFTYHYERRDEVKNYDAARMLETLREMLPSRFQNAVLFTVNEDVTLLVSAKGSRGVLRDRVSIDQRPTVVDQKIRFGDLEIDTIVGSNHKGAILTINDRLTSFCWIELLKGRNAKELADAAVRRLLPVKEHIRTITSDNGKEFAEHKNIAEKLGVDFFFAHPYHSWERGANENTNGLIRQYIPKGSSFENLTDDYIRLIERKVNNRPREKLGFLTPNERLFSIFAAIN